MSATPREPGGAAAPVGLLREAIALAAAALVTRGELAAVELTEARDRAGEWLALALVAAVLLLAALLVAALFVVSLFWETYRSQAIAAVAVAYAVAGAVLAARLRARLRQSPPLLQATLAELKRDSEALRSRSSA